MPRHVAYGHLSTDFAGLDSNDPDPRRSMILAAVAAGIFSLVTAFVHGDEVKDADPSAVLQRLAEARSASDACLRAVQFVDASEGWAVGDQGVIWHTMDGGTIWERQPSGVQATLTSLAMLDPRNGWIGARQPLPCNPGSTGFLLATNDGTTWKRSPEQCLPGLNKVGMFSSSEAWLVGDASDQHPTGVFFTNNGGRTWIGARGPRAYGWLAGMFFGMDFGVVGGIAGPFASPNEAHGFIRPVEPGFAQFHRGNIRPGKADWLPNTTVRDFAASAKSLWAVGDQGQIFHSDDRGGTWKRPNLKLPPEICKAWDFHAISAIGEKIWICGRPGTIILHSPDDGATWQTQSTNQPLPIYDMHFADASHGWAVGALGTILNTRDGGAAWQVQRQGGKRAAALWLCQDARNIPLTVVARLGANDGYLNVGYGLTSPDLAEDPPTCAGRPMRIADGFRAAGGAHCECRSRFPLSDDHVDCDVQELLRRWDSQCDGQATREIERDLVLAIRIYRPEIVITEALKPSTSNSMAATLAAMGVRRACQTASDPNVFPEQIQQMGLAPHRPSRVFAKSEGDAEGIKLSAAEIGRRIGATYSDLAEAAYPLALEGHRPVESSAQFVLVESQDGKAGTERGLLAGLSIEPGSDARRSLLSDNAVDKLANAAIGKAEKKKNILAIIERGNDQQSERQLAHLKQITSDLDPQQAGQVVFAMAKRYAAAGRWDFAQPAFDYLVREFPDHPMALEGYRWLIAYHASSEARRRAPKPAVVEESSTAFIKKNEQSPTKTIQTNDRLAIEDPNAIERWCRSATAYGDQLRKRSPHLYSDPRIQLCLAAAQRQVGSLDQVKAIHSTLLNNDPDSRWAQVTRMESFLYGSEAGAPPLGIAWTVQTDKRPKLDGILDDECWQSGKRLPLICGDERFDKPFASDVIFRHDGDYLYIAAECRYPSAEFQVAKVDRTGHDADVQGSDRIEILIDPDRDYTTFYRLRIDQRGLVADDCWGDSSWNPKWFVATSSDETGWRSEIAIPLAELADYISPRETWAFNVVRIMPGRAVQAWNHPASVQPRPEGFGHLRFMKKDRSASVLGSN